MIKIPVPTVVFCPKCGKSMNLEKITDTKTMVKLKELSYVTASRGICSCGVYAVLAIKKIPDNPTFTLMFNIYKLEGG